MSGLIIPALSKTILNGSINMSRAKTEALTETKSAAKTAAKAEIKANTKTEAKRVKSTSLAKVESHSQTQGAGLSDNVEDVTCLVAGFFTELIGVHKEYKKTMATFNKSICIADASNKFMAKSNKHKFKKYHGQTLTGDMKFCFDLCANFSEDDPNALNAPGFTTNHLKCANLLKNDNVGVMDMVTMLFDTTKEIKACLEKTNPNGDALVSACKTGLKILGSVFMNFVFPGLGLIISGIKISWYMILVTRQLDLNTDTQAQTWGKHRRIGKYAARILKECIPGLRRRKHKKLR